MSSRIEEKAKQNNKIRGLGIPPAETEQLVRMVEEEDVTLLGLPSVVSRGLPVTTLHEELIRWEGEAKGKGYKGGVEEWVEAMGRQGYTPAEIAGELSLSKERLLGYMKDDETFYDTIKKAHTLAEGYYAKIARENLISPRGITFNSKVWSLFMMSCFAWKTREDIALDTPQSGGGVVYLPPLEDE